LPCGGTGRPLRGHGSAWPWRGDRSHVPPGGDHQRGGYRYPSSTGMEMAYRGSGRTLNREHDPAPVDAARMPAIKK